MGVYYSFKPGSLKSARHFKARGILFGICNGGGVIYVFNLVTWFRVGEEYFVEDWYRDVIWHYYFLGIPLVMVFAVQLI